MANSFKNKLFDISDVDGETVIFTSPTDSVTILQTVQLANATSINATVSIKLYDTSESTNEEIMRGKVCKDSSKNLSNGVIILEENDYITLTVTGSGATVTGTVSVLETNRAAITGTVGGGG